MTPGSIRICFHLFLSRAAYSETGLARVCRKWPKGEKKGGGRDWSHLLTTPAHDGAVVTVRYTLVRMHVTQLFWLVGGRERTVICIASQQVGTLLSPPPPPSSSLSRKQRLSQAREKIRTPECIRKTHHVTVYSVRTQAMHVRIFELCNGNSRQRREERERGGQVKAAAAASPLIRVGSEKIRKCSFLSLLCQQQLARPRRRFHSGRSSSS